MTQRKRWLKTREFEKGECVAVRRPGKADTDRNAQRPPFVCVLVWVYFVHKRFESGFRDLTLCVKVLRMCFEPDDCENDNKIILATQIRVLLPPLFKSLSIRKGIQETS